MKKLKGILSIFIVMIMALSVQVPAFADEAGEPTICSARW